MLTERILRAARATQSLADTGAIASTSSFTLGGTERLRVLTCGSVAGVTMRIVVRRLDEHGALQYDQYEQEVSSDRSTDIVDYPLGAGQLLTVIANARNAECAIGECYVRVGVALGSSSDPPAVATLIQSYVTRAQHAFWPGSPLRHSWEGPGALKIIAGDLPAVGDPLVLTCPDGARWRIRWLAGGIQKNANPALRAVVRINTSGVETGFLLSPVLQPAVTSWIYCLFPTLENIDFSVPEGVVQIGIFPDLVLLPGDTLTWTLWGGPDPTDQIGGFNAAVEEWLELT